MAITSTRPGAEVKQRAEAYHRPRRAAGLDGLRGVAVLAVVVFHGKASWLPGGFLGVDVFFVLSGYLITDLLCAKRPSPTHYWLCRARRIVPALVAVLIGSTAAAALIGPERLAGIRGDVLASATFTSNWWQLATEKAYFTHVEPQPMLTHLWSLAVEEQFYLVWPLALLALSRFVRRRALIMSIVVVAAAVSLAAMVVMFRSGSGINRVYLGSDTHAFALLAGGALALCVPLHRPARHVGIDLLGVAGLVTLGWLMFATTDSDGFLFRGGYLFVVIAAAAGLVAAIPSTGLVGRGLSWPPLRWVGERSYGIYLWHWPVMLLAMSMAGGSTIVRFGVAVAITTALAALSYRWLEKPVRDLGFLEAGRRALNAIRRTQLAGLVAVTCGLTVLAAAVTGMVTAPVNSGLVDQITRGEAVIATPTPEVTTTTEPPRLPPATVSAIGDSVMLAVAEDLTARVPGITIDAATSRQMSAAPGIIQKSLDNGTLGSAVIIGLGTNGPFDTGTLESALDKIGPRRQVLLVNTYVPRSWQDNVNRTLADVARHRPNVTLVDWHEAARTHPAALWDDHIHPRPDQARLYTDMILAALPTRTR